MIIIKNLVQLPNVYLNTQYYPGYNGLNNFFLRFQLKKLSKRLFQLRAFKHTQSIAPATPTFQGQIYVLVGPTCFSACGEFAGMLKEHTNAIFIGQETGGNPYQNVSSLTPTLVLPHSNVRMTLPFVVSKTNMLSKTQVSE